MISSFEGRELMSEKKEPRASWIWISIGSVLLVVIQSRAGAYGIFNSLASTLPLSWELGLGCIANDYCTAIGPSVQRLLEYKFIRGFT